MDENIQRKRRPKPTELRANSEKAVEKASVQRNETIEQPVRKRKISEAGVARPRNEGGSAPVRRPRPKSEGGETVKPRVPLTPEEVKRRRAQRANEELRRPRTQKKSVQSVNVPLTRVEEAEQVKPLEETAKKPILTTGSHEMKKRSVRSKRRKRGCIYGVVALIVLLILASVGGILYMKKYGLSNEEMNSSKYYEMSRSADLVAILDNEIIGVQGMVENDIFYFTFDFVEEYLNDRFYWDSNAKAVLYTLENGTIRAVADESQYTFNDEITQTDYPIVKTIAEESYIAAEFVQQYTNIDYTTFTDPNRIVITSEWTTIEYTTAKKDTEVRYQAGVKSPILTYVEEGDKLIYLEQDVEEWTKVCTLDGYIGYLQSKNVNETETETLSRAFEEQTYSNITHEETINLAFHQVTTDSISDAILGTMDGLDGVTVIAPTWFFLSSTEGDVTSIATQEYVAYAHNLGLDVWGVLNDIDGGMNSQSETLEVLKDTEKRAKVIDTVMAEAQRTGLDGINVDIESVSSEAGVHYVQFIRELSVSCRENGLVLSVDNYPPKPYNMHFNYKEQGIVADYVIIMSYDEHYRGSLEAGSVSSITYVEEAVTEMLTMVPAEKIINAIPFYTRLWAATPKTADELAEQEGTEEAEYPNNISSESYGMDNAATVVAEAGATATWDDETQQNYATWTVDNTTYQIWLEDEESIAAKLQVMQENNLAGTAAWKLGFETSEIWEVIQQYLN